MGRHRIRWTALAVATSLLTCGAALAEDAARDASPPVKHLTECPENVADFIDSDASATFVKQCLGKPVFESQRPDGKFSYIYETRDGKFVMAFAFNPDGSLIRARGYAKD
jgi:hypothetical protein